MFKIKKMTNASSTNTILKENIDNIENGTVILADKQSGGRGRHGKSFESPEGGLYMSVYLDAVYSTGEMPFVTVLSGIAVRRAILDITGLDAKIKWPNDIFIGGKKVCGILTELVKRRCGYGVIIGIGLNVLSDKNLPDMATSILRETGKVYDIRLFAEKVLTNIGLLYGKCDKIEIAKELKANILKHSDEMDNWLRYYNL